MNRSENWIEFVSKGLPTPRSSELCTCILLLVSHFFVLGLNGSWTVPHPARVSRRLACFRFGVARL